MHVVLNTEKKFFFNAPSPKKDYVSIIFKILLIAKSSFNYDGKINLLYQ